MAGPGKAQSPPGPGNGLTYPFTPFNTIDQQRAFFFHW